MILKVFSLYDMKTGIFAAPFVMAHIGQAVRACKDLGSDLSTLVGRHPADYMLVELGNYDDNTGVFENAMVHHASVVSLLEPEVPLGKLFEPTGSVIEPVAAHPGKDM